MCVYWYQNISSIGTGSNVIPPKVVIRLCTSFLQTNYSTRIYMYIVYTHTIATHSNNSELLTTYHNSSLPQPQPSVTWSLPALKVWREEAEREKGREGRERERESSLGKGRQRSRWLVTWAVLRCAGLVFLRTYHVFCWRLRCNARALHGFFPPSWRHVSLFLAASESCRTDRALASYRLVELCS